MADWAGQRDVALRDAVMLVPSPRHLPLARAAWAGAGGWMPRIETIDTLAAALGPQVPAAPGALSGDAAADRLTAAALLRRHAGFDRDKDPRVLAHVVAALTDTAHQLADAAAMQAPSAREGWWAAAGVALAGSDALEATLARAALAWAQTAPQPRTDRVFELQASAWIAVDDGIGDRRAMQCLQVQAGRGRRCLWLDASGAEADTPPSFALADDFEDEAQRTAACVLQHLQQGRQPVALVAQDRLLVRRVRALLERQQVVIADETGWKLSTTRAAAAVMAAVRTADPAARLEHWLDWVKSLPATHWPDAPPQAPLEQVLRAMRLPRLHDGPGSEALPESLRDAWMSSLRWLDPLALPARLGRPLALADWLRALDATLSSSGARGALGADRAGVAVLAALRLEPPALPGSAFEMAAASAAMSFGEFAAWVDAVLEDAVFLPGAPDGSAAEVVITPLRQIALRPFAALVFPGVDERRLAAEHAPHPLLTVAQQEALGLPTPAQARLRDEEALAQALLVPNATLLRRRIDGTEPLATSALVARIEARMRRLGRPFTQAEDPRPLREAALAPVAVPAPRASAGLPTVISIHACEALRACPYRFYSRVLLGLHEGREPGEDADRRDHGSWLHEVLDRFHRERPEPRGAAEDLACLLAIGEETRAAMRFEIEAFLPYESAFRPLAEGYVDWLHARERGGAAWDAGELDVEARPEGWPVQLRGRIDRVDRCPQPDGTLRLEVLDYKTGSMERIRERVREPLEDTQLAGYAALMIASGAAEPGEVDAAYLRLSERKGVEAVPHPDVSESATAFVADLGRELARIQAGEPLPPLGEGDLCDYCEARGLCRRDHWNERPAAEELP